MIFNRRISSSKSPIGGEKKRILLILAAKDLAGHLSSLDQNRWKIEKREAWPDGEASFLTLVDGLNIKAEDVKKEDARLTVYLSPEHLPAYGFTGDLGYFSFPREQFLRMDGHFSLSLFGEIASMIKYIKRLEEGFQPYMRQAQLGAALQGFVHNVNNQMTSIIALLDIVRHENSHLIDIALIFEQCQRLHADFSNLLRVSRRDRAREVTSFDINALIQEELRLLMVADPFLRNRVMTHLNKSLPPFHGIYSDFSHSFINLIRNASDAISTVDDPHLIIRTGQDAKSVWLEVEDDGIGIPEYMLDEVFKPYFSLHEHSQRQNGSGLGLGLSTSRELLEKYGVEWKVESQVGVGTRFVLNFLKQRVCQPPDS